jgi:hypothetical protein
MRWTAWPHRVNGKAASDRTFQFAWNYKRIDQGDAGGGRPEGCPPRSRIAASGNLTGGLAGDLAKFLTKASETLLKYYERRGVGLDTE